jgi:hypothetical protein
VLQLKPCSYLGTIFFEIRTRNSGFPACPAATSETLWRDLFKIQFFNPKASEPFSE